jgi:hypothetical protein
MNTTTQTTGKELNKDAPFVDLIYSFSESGQKFDKINITQHVLNSRDLFFLLVCNTLSNREKETLSKISCCVYWAEKLNRNEPTWYNGKFWDNEIPELIMRLFGIVCTYEPINK